MTDVVILVLTKLCLKYCELVIIIKNLLQIKKNLKIKYPKDTKEKCQNYFIKPLKNVL